MKQPKIQMWEHVIWTGYPLLLLGMFFLPVLSLQGCFSCILWTGFKLAAGLLQRKNVPSQFIAVVCQGMIVVLFTQTEVYSLMQQAYTTILVL